MGSKCNPEKEARRKQLMEFIGLHPGLTCNEINDGLRWFTRKTRGMLSELFTHDKIYGLKEGLYYRYYLTQQAYDLGLIGEVVNDGWRVTNAELVPDKETYY